MKHFFYTVTLLALCIATKAQNVGIGTTTPTTKLTVVNAGFGIEHNDGTISLRSFVGTNIGMFGTSTNHAFHLSANNTTGQLVIMPTGVVGIGNSDPLLAGLVADKKIGAVNAMFGSNTTGIALESNWPGIGFNSYYNNGRKFIGSGYGGVIGFNPTNGYFTLASTAVSGVANAAAATTDILTATNSGNIGIGTSNPSAKLEVNGAFKLTDGTQGADKVLTSDASGNASWKTASGGNTERFQYQLNRNGTGSGAAAVLYNTGTASFSNTSANITIYAGKPGLYHFDMNFYSSTATNTPVQMNVFSNKPNVTIIQNYLLAIKDPNSSVYFQSYEKSFSIYLDTTDALVITPVMTAAPATSFTLTVTGNMIAP